MSHTCFALSTSGLVLLAVLAALVVAILGSFVSTAAGVMAWGFALWRFTRAAFALSDFTPAAQ